MKLRIRKRSSIKRRLFGSTRFGRLTAAAGLFVAVFISSVAGQGNQEGKPVYGNLPTKPVSKEERERLFKAGLKLDPPPKGAVELVLRRTIPTDEEIEAKEIFFRNVVSFSVDERGHVFIPESFFTAVFEFDQMGCLLKKYDKKGQGPGELRFPNRILFWNQEIIVHDGQARRVMFFGRDWTFVRSFAYSKIYSPQAVGPDGKIYAVNLFGDYLVEVLDREGRIIDSFGALPAEKKSVLNDALLAVSPSNSVWVACAALGKVKKYSSEGKLQSEIDLLPYGSRKLKEYYDQNLTWAKKGESKTYRLILGVSVCGDDVLIQAGGLLQPIFRFDSEGRYKGSYYIKPLGPSFQYSGAKILADERGAEEFYIMRNDYGSDDIRVGVYSAKTGNR